jgi:hypothetical protein
MRLGALLGTEPSMLDLSVLADHVGNDPEFEREFLGLLLPTVRACIDSMQTQSRDLYSILHGAKPGILIACPRSMAQDFEEVCNWALAHKDMSPLVAERPASHARLLAGLTQMENTIRSVLVSA